MCNLVYMARPANYVSLGLRSDYVDRLEAIRVNLGEKSIARTIYRLVEDHESNKTLVEAQTH